MKHLLTIISCFVALSMSAQVEEFPFNPDADSDEQITVDDLMAMLSLFGQPFIMPDYSEWASGSMLNILAFQDSLADIASDLDALNDSLSNVQSELIELSDSLEQIVDFNSFITTQSPCYIHVYDDPHTYQIQDNCGFVVVTAEYGQTWPFDINDRAKIHLPQTGLFEGQKIFMFRTADYSDHIGHQVRQFVDGSWQVLTEIWEDQGPGNANWDSSLSNKVFTWSGESWSVSTVINYIYQN